MLAIVLALAEVSSALQCGGQMECPECKDIKPEDCKSGCLTKDICGCCYVCAKAKGDHCEGINNYHGYCADGLYCDKPGKLATGICKGKKRNSRSYRLIEAQSLIMSVLFYQ